jgi:hypothetical protein
MVLVEGASSVMRRIAIASALLHMGLQEQMFGHWDHWAKVNLEEYICICCVWASKNKYLVHLPLGRTENDLVRVGVNEIGGLVYFRVNWVFSYWWIMLIMKVLWWLNWLHVLARRWSQCVMGSFHLKIFENCTT